MTTQLKLTITHNFWFGEEHPSALWNSFCPPWRWAGSSTLAWMPTYVSILRIPQMIWVWRATVEWYWQGETEELGENPVPVPLCSPQIPHGLTRAWTLARAVRGRRLTTWAMARPLQNNSSSERPGLLPISLSVCSWLPVVRSRTNSQRLWPWSAGVRRP
jgi:hypothetical protein